ncbi:hypothetical protein [uncultured Agitococcus sp.]|uniref:hypothetical protein n=1 Tax=uncultured Agitococcus sp. TaxID=1506599 RepID=UPI0026366E5C|nr:hypothetical protein [uncultured Agitococcus sp.]
MADSSSFAILVGWYVVCHLNYNGYFRDGVAQHVRGMDAEFCATNGFAYFCQNKSKACRRQ